MLEKFASVTAWQGEGWEIDAIVDGFSNATEAAFFGYSVRSLVRKGDCLILIDGDGELIQLSDLQVKVRQVKSEEEEKGIIGSEDDYIERDIPIYLFSEIKGLNGTFSSLSFGVTDENSTPVLFDASSFKKSIEIQNTVEKSF